MVPTTHLETQEHHLVSIYAEEQGVDIEKKLSQILPQKATKVLMPSDAEMLVQASRNCSLTIVAVWNSTLKNAEKLAKKLSHERMIVNDIIALKMEELEADDITLQSYGFDLTLTQADLERLETKTLLRLCIKKGSQRLRSLLLEEEYRRFSDALSCAPTSVLVFDNDKRLVFVSEHYFRSYPKSAPRLVRGLSVYDAFDMMSREEGVLPDHPLHATLREFWYGLNDDLEFTLDSGISYRLKAAPLPDQRGTIVTAQNVTEYVRQKEELKNAMAYIKNLQDISTQKSSSG